MPPKTDISLTHYSPGRLRLKAPGLKSDSAFAEQIRSTLAAVPGISRASIGALTGSLLLEFSPEELSSPPASRRLLEALGSLFPEAFGEDSITIGMALLGGREQLAKRLAESLEAMEAVLDAHFSGAALVVRYDPAKLSIPAVLDRLAQ
jgi:hypothetical protein